MVWALACRWVGVVWLAGWGFGAGCCAEYWVCMMVGKVCGNVAFFSV